MTPEPDRRSFLQWAIFGMGGIFSAILGVPVIAYVIDPRHRKAPKSAFKPVDGVKLDELVRNVPVQGVVRDTRTDGWTLYPDDVIGRVWVVRKGPRPAADLTSRAKVEEFNQDTGKKFEYLLVFTTICPHLGCSVNLNSAGTEFACPCHAATYDFKGDRVNEGNPAKREMDTLEWEIDADDPLFTRIKVKYQNFKTLEPTKEAIE